MQIAERLYSLAQEQNDPRLVLEAYANCATAFYFLGEYETARQYARLGVQPWRSGGIQSYAEVYLSPVMSCLIYWAMSEWHFGEIVSCNALMDEAISIAKELKDMNSLAMALSWAAGLRFRGRNAPKKSTQSTAAKKRAGQEDVDSDYLFGDDSSQGAVSRFVGSPALSNKRLRCKARTLRLQAIR